MNDEAESLRSEAQKIVDEFLVMYPHGCPQRSLAGELSRVWRIVQHWHSQLLGAERKVKMIRRSAIGYKRCQMFTDYMKRTQQEIENKRLRDLVRHAWIHTSYRDCGYDQMTIEQKMLYHRVIGRPASEGGGCHPEVSLRERLGRTEVTDAQ
jgi:hypothetical protein